MESGWNPLHTLSGGQVLPGSRFCSLLAKSLDPGPHLIYYNQLNLSESLRTNPMLDGTGTQNCVLGRQWSLMPHGYICLSCWLWHSALFSRSTALCVCWVYALSCLLCPCPFLETHPALLKNWGAPFSCLSISQALRSIFSPIAPTSSRGVVVTVKALVWDLHFPAMCSWGFN